MSIFRKGRVMGSVRMAKKYASSLTSKERIATTRLLKKAHKADSLVAKKGKELAKAKSASKRAWRRLRKADKRTRVRGTR